MNYPSGLNPTSVAAHESIRWFISRQDREIIAALKVAENGLTREELVDRTGIKIQSVCARCNELLHQKILQNRSLPGTTDPVQRRTNSGRWADVLYVNTTHPEVL